MAQITMYATAVCPFCIRAEQLLAKKGQKNIKKILVDKDPALRIEMQEKTKRRTVPQIFIGDVWVGGYDDLSALDSAGKLDALLSSN